MLQGDNYLYYGIAVQRKNPSAPYAIVYSAPAVGFAGVAAINTNTVRPYAAALWTDWSLTEESQKFVASEFRGPITLKHPVIPESMAPTMPARRTPAMVTAARVESPNEQCVCIGYLRSAFFRVFRFA